MLALRSILFLLACSSLALPASAQGGYRKEKYRALGLELPIARHYEQLPVQPTEKWSILKFAQKTERTETSNFRPTLDVIRIDRTNPEIIEREDEKGVTTSTPIDGIEAYLDHRFSKWDIERQNPETDNSSAPTREYDLHWEAPETARSYRERSAFYAWTCAFETPSQTIALIGVCSRYDEDDLAKQRKIWRYTADRFKIGEPDNREAEKLRRYYERRKYVAVDYRIAVRAILPKGWNAEDTENYLIVFDTKDEPLIRLIKSELEAIRKEYIKSFPPAAPITAVSTVRVCKDRDEYYQYGGSRGSGGYWNPVGEELVFYDYENIDRKSGSGKANSRIVLYHEAFHQYIHYSTGELPPHSWFNEGYGDYFSGAVISAGKVKKIGVNPWRAATIQRAIRDDRYVPLADLLAFEQKDYYANPSVCYAQGWSLIYFLRESSVARKNKVWSRILPTYFETLKSSYASELSELSEAVREDEEERARAGKRARTTALQRAFSDVNLDQFEAAWRNFTLSLKLPR